MVMGGGGRGGGKGARHNEGVSGGKGVGLARRRGAEKRDVRNVGSIVLIEKGGLVV